MEKSATNFSFLESKYSGHWRNLFRLVLRPGHGARALALGLVPVSDMVPKLFLRHLQKAMLRLDTSVPRYLDRYSTKHGSVNCFPRTASAFVESQLIKWFSCVWTQITVFTRKSASKPFSCQVFLHFDLVHFITEYVLEPFVLKTLETFYQQGSWSCFKWFVCQLAKLTKLFIQNFQWLLDFCKY